MVIDIWPRAAKSEAGFGYQRGGAQADGWDGLAVQAERRGLLVLAMLTKPTGSVKAQLEPVHP